MPPWCTVLTFQPRAYACSSSTERFICLYLFLCCRGKQGWGGHTQGPSVPPTPGGEWGRAQHSRDPPTPTPHHVATEPRRDEDLALAHQLVALPAAPTTEHLLDEGGQLGHALLAPLLQVKELRMGQH